MMPIFQNVNNDYLESTLYKSLASLISAAPKSQMPQNIATHDSDAVHCISYTESPMYDSRLPST